MKASIAAGACTAVVAGGLMAALTASAGGLAGSLPAVAALTLSLVAAGAGYGWLVESGRVQEGLPSGILFWSAALPAARIAQGILVGAGLPESLPAFVTYQALVGGAFGLGFLLLQAQISTLLRRVRPKEALPPEGLADK